MSIAISYTLVQTIAEVLVLYYTLYIYIHLSKRAETVAHEILVSAKSFSNNNHNKKPLHSIYIYDSIKSVILYIYCFQVESDRSWQQISFVRRMVTFAGIVSF